MNNPQVSVVGSVFVDCKGFPFQKYSPLTRNLGSIQFVHGGVGRNVVENLARLSIPTSFVSTVDDSAMGKEVTDRLESLRVDTAFTMPAPTNGMGWWLAIINECGELTGSISQMPDLAVLEKLVNTHGEEIISRSTHLVLEIDLNIEIVQRLLKLTSKHNIPVYGIPGNMDIVLKHREVLRGMTCFICNNYEVDLLTGENFSERSVEEQKTLLANFVKKVGLSSMIATLGDKGSVFYDANTGEAGFQPVYPVQVADSSGAGDSFFSGAVAALVRGATIQDAAYVGTKVAGWTIEHAESTCPVLHSKVDTDEKVKDILINGIPSYTTL